MLFKSNKECTHCDNTEMLLLFFNLVTTNAESNELAKADKFKFRWWGMTSAVASVADLQ